MNRVRPAGPHSRTLFLAVLVIAACPPAFASGPGTPAFVIDAETRVSLSGATRLTLDCDLRNHGSFLPAAGSTVVLAGFGSPLLTGASFADLSLALHGTAAIANPATVNGTLALGSGRLSLSGFDLTVNGGVTGGSAASYVMTPDTLGRLVRSVGAGADVVFPVGNSSYDPLSVRTGTGSDLFRVAVLDAPPATGLDPASALTRAWAVSHANAPGVNGPLTCSVQWNAGEQGASFDRSPSLPSGAWAWRFVNGAWSPRANVRRSDNGGYPAVDSLVTTDGGLWTLAGVVQLLDAGPNAAEAPFRLELAPASPNPFRGATTLRYGLPQRAHVTFSIYSVLGERAVVLADGEQAAGWHVVRLEDARLASGVYFVRLQAGAESRTAKLVVMR